MVSVRSFVPRDDNVRVACSPPLQHWTDPFADLVLSIELNGGNIASDQFHEVKPFILASRNHDASSSITVVLTSSSLNTSTGWKLVLQWPFLHLQDY